MLNWILDPIEAWWQEYGLYVDVILMGFACVSILYIKVMYGRKNR